MNKSLPQHNHVCWPEKKEERNNRPGRWRGGMGGGKGGEKKQVNVMNYSKGVGCTPEVSALWPLWQEVKGSAIAAGINRADYLDLVQKAAEPELSVRLHQHVRLEIYISVNIKCIIYMYYQHSVSVFMMSVPGIFFSCLCGLPAWEADLWPPQPDAGNESFSLPSQQHVPSYYKIHVEAGTAFLIFHTRGDKVNMRGSEDGYQARRVIANWVMFGYTLRAL